MRLRTFASYTLAHIQIPDLSSWHESTSPWIASEIQSGLKAKTNNEINEVYYTIYAFKSRRLYYMLCEFGSMRKCAPVRFNKKKRTWVLKYQLSTKSISYCMCVCVCRNCRTRTWDPMMLLFMCSWKIRTILFCVLIRWRWKHNNYMVCGRAVSLPSKMSHSFIWYEGPVFLGNETQNIVFSGKNLFSKIMPSFFEHFPLKI